MSNEYTLSYTAKEIDQILKDVNPNPEIVITGFSDKLWYNKDGVPTEYYFPAGELNCSKETNFISVKKGDIFQVTAKGSDGWAANGGWYDKNKNLLSIIIFNSPSQKIITTTVTAPANAAYVRFFSLDYNTSDYNTVTLNVAYRGQINDSSFFSPRLKGKKIVYDGDSICAPWGSKNGGAYPQIIASITDSTFDNQAVGGGRIVTREGSNETYHSIVDNIVNLPLDGDLYCFEGGVNDHWHGITLGDFSKSDYSETYINALDKTTYCGALESIFVYATTHFIGKPICYIITHKCPSSAFSSGYPNENGEKQPDTFADFREKALGICEKYSIPVYDAWKDSGINSWNSQQLSQFFVIDETTGTGDGTHPNEDGYRRYYIPQLIQLFESILPIIGEQDETNILNKVKWIDDATIDDPDTGEIIYYEGRKLTGLIPVKYRDIIYVSNIIMPDDKKNHQNVIAYYNEDGSWDTLWNLTSNDGGSSKHAAAVYDADGNLSQFTAIVNGFIRLGCVHIDETSSIRIQKSIN